MSTLPFKTSRSEAELASKRESTPQSRPHTLPPHERRMRRDYSFLANRFRQKRDKAKAMGRTEREMLGLQFNLSVDEWIALWREVIPKLPVDFPENGLKNLGNPYVPHVPAYEFRSKGAIPRMATEPNASEAGAIPRSATDAVGLTHQNPLGGVNLSGPLGASLSPSTPLPATPVPPEGGYGHTEPYRRSEGHTEEVGAFKRLRGDNTAWYERGELTPAFKLQIRKVDKNQPFERGNLQLVCVHIGDRKLEDWGEGRTETVVWADDRPVC